MVRVAVGIQHFRQGDVGLPVRPVLVALPPLVLDHVALRVDGLRRHRVEQVSHSIRFEKQRQLDGVRRHVDPVVRPIVGRRSVVVAARGLQPLVELSRLHMTGSHEHQVLEQVGEAGAAGPLARRSDVVPHVHGDKRHAVILVQDDAQSVGQSRLTVRNFKLLEGGH